MHRFYIKSAACFTYSKNTVIQVILLFFNNFSIFFCILKKCALI